MMKTFHLDNKISMVTGGSSGIGFGIAKALAEAGSDIVLVARDKTNLNRTREELAGTGHILYVDGGLLSTFGPSSWQESGGQITNL